MPSSPGGIRTSTNKKRIRLVALECSLHLLQRLVALIRGIEVEAFGEPLLLGAEDLGFERVEIGAVGAAPAEDLAEVLVDRTIVVDDQDPPIRRDQASDRARLAHLAPPASAKPTRCGIASA
jgi:hypothetical protein